MGSYSLTSLAQFLIADFLHPYLSAMIEPRMFYMPSNMKEKVSY